MTNQGPLTEQQAESIVKQIDEIRYAMLPKWVQKELEEQERLKNYAQYLLERMFV